jgi:hypothetical protein
MKRTRLWIACGAISLIGGWQLVAMAQQPKQPRQPSPPPVHAIEEDEIGSETQELIESLNEQVRELTEQAEELSHQDSSDKEDANHDIRAARKDIETNLQQLRAKAQALGDEVRRLNEGRIEESKARGQANEARRRANEAKIKAKAEAKQKVNRQPKLDHRMPVQVEVDVAETIDPMHPHGPQMSRRMMVQDHNGRKIVVHGDFLGRASQSPEEAKQLAEFRKLVSDYRKEKDQQRKGELRESIKEQLASQLDRDIESRKAKLNEMEERVQRLRNQLEASEGTKDATVDSLLQMLEGDNANPFGISPAWLDALSAVGLYRDSAEHAAFGQFQQDHVITTPALALDLGILNDQLPQISVGIPPAGLDVLKRVLEPIGPTPDVRSIDSPDMIAPPSAEPAFAPVPTAPLAPTAPSADAAPEIPDVPPAPEEPSADADLVELAEPVSEE